MHQDVVKAFALSLPEAIEEPHFDKVSFRVRGKIFATLPPEGNFVHIFVDEHEVRGVVADNPSVFHELWWGRRLMGVRVELTLADQDLVFALVESSWRLRAPQRLHDKVDGTS